MTDLYFGKGKISVDPERGLITDISYKGEKVSKGSSVLFRVGLRGPAGEAVVLDAASGRHREKGSRTEGAFEAGYVFEGGVEVVVRASVIDGGICWRGDILNTGELTAEWIELPLTSLKPLKGEGGSASMLIPFNEGVICESTVLRQSTWYRTYEINYPSIGCYPVFPNMMCSQFEAYISEDFGLYIGAHDPVRGLKVIDFYDAPGWQPEAESGGEEAGQAPVTAVIRIYCGSETGDDYRMDFPVVWKFFEGGWEDAAEIYRDWFEKHLPPRAVKSADNSMLPEWYFKSPLVVSYPVRGIHDMDEMKPNALFPYCRALPLLDDIRAKTGTDLLVLLMHWEGTAPWAPPYVWPPYGGIEEFNRFRDALHAAGDKLGVYCSGFGYTMKSNLIESYSNEETFQKEGLEEAMCVGPDGVLKASAICPGQRSGYDICPASPKGRKIVDEAYAPLLKSGIDYAQILDQNHGGGQYLCYSRRHGHPPVPGDWMTTSMQDLLSGWKDAAGTMLLGCESAAAEPFIGNLLFSDNRFELNWSIGRPVPLFTYVYHEYLRNFMGNQVSSPFLQEEDSLFLRLAYSFTAGDCLTVVLTPDGRVMDHWGGRDFDTLPDPGEVLSFVRALTGFAAGETGEIIARGRMVKGRKVDCTSRSYRTRNGAVELPDVFTSAFTMDGRTLQIFVNHTKHDVRIDAEGCIIDVPARSAVSMEL